MNIALLTAAGSGTRMGQDIPKVIEMPCPHPPLVHGLEQYHHGPIFLQRLCFFLSLQFLQSLKIIQVLIK